MSVGIHAGVIKYHKWFLYKKCELSFIDHQFELFGDLVHYMLWPKLLSSSIGTGNLSKYAEADMALSMQML